MKILVVGFRFDAAGGLEIVSAGLAQALAGLGHEVRCAAMGMADCWESESYRGVGLAPRSRLMNFVHSRWPGLTAGAKLREMLSWSNLVIVCHCHLLPFVQQCLSRQAGERTVVAWLHGREVWGRFAEEYASSLRRAEMLVAVSKYTSDTVVELLGEQHRPIVIPNPVDTSIFHPAAQQADVVRWSLFTAGRHGPDTEHKGYDLLIDALAMVRDRDRSLPLSLTIGGRGPRLAALRQHAKQAGVGERVQFPGQLTRSQLVRHYANSDVFAFPSRVMRIDDEVWGEGFGVVNIEAAACGRPVLTSTHGGCPETILEGRTGLLVDPTAVESIAEGMLQMFAMSPEERDAMGACGREFVVEQFSFPAFRQRLKTLVDQSLASSRKR
jgi:phosphatidyl-myo-inositol dimannoside synthase